MFALLLLLAGLHLTATDNGKSFTVKPQTPIVVTLVSNPSAGYHWKYVALAGGGKVVKLVSQRYVAPSSARPGSAGKEILGFRAVARGKLMMRFRYVDSWQPNKPVTTVGVKIAVH